MKTHRTAGQVDDRAGRADRLGIKPRAGDPYLSQQDLDYVGLLVCRAADQQNAGLGVARTVAAAMGQAAAPGAVLPCRRRFPQVENICRAGPGPAGELS